MNIFNKINSSIQKLKERAFFNFLLNKYTIAIVIFLLVICFFDTNNVGVWVKTEKLIREQERQIELRSNEIKELEKKIDQLENVQDSLEKFAREEFYFHETDEDVYIFEE